MQPIDGYEFVRQIRTDPENPKGDPCKFIDPPNLLLAKVTHNPAMAEVRSAKTERFSFDPSRLEKMTAIIKRNQTICIDTLDKKIKEIEPLYEGIRQDKTFQRNEICKKIEYIYGVAKALDHIQVARITMSLLDYLTQLPPETPADTNIILTHFDALFNRETLNIKLDPPTKMVLTALEALTNHALASSR